MQAVLVKPLGGDEEPWFRSVIVDFTPDRELVIILPSAKDRVPDDDGDEPRHEPPQASEATAEADDDDEGADATEFLFGMGRQLEVEISFPDGIRRFSAVVRKQALGFGGSLHIDWPNEGTRIQRRDYVRVEVGYPIVVSFKDPEEGKLRKVSGATMDLSAGGMRLRLPEAIPDNTRIELQVDTEALRTRALQGRVVRSAEIAGKRTNNPPPPEFWVAVELVGVDEALRKEMTQIVFDIQRQLMKRSLT